MRCNQELYGHINCDREVILGEKYCRFHFAPSLRIEINKLQTENAKLRECLKACPILGEIHRDSNDRFKEWNLEFNYVLKELEDK